MPQALAFDYGKKRTGIAVTDDDKIIASGLDTIDTSLIFQFLKKYLSENTVDTFVLGEPTRLDGGDSHASEGVRKFKLHLEKKYPNIPVELINERFTSKMAFQTMLDSGIGKKARRNKATIDKISATIILQSYLEKVENQSQ